ncbi:MAG: hypothetical protein KAH22_10395 [Thiotrichaceae bacterium]|nr:hypothetical protein [Thiotrichaceae bacterium]
MTHQENLPTSHVNDTKSPTKPLSFWGGLRHSLLSDPLSNVPSFLFIGVALFGITTLVTSFITDLLVFPFLLIAIFSSIFAMWHIRMLGSLKEQIERLTEENNTFTLNNETLTHNVDQFTQENEKLSSNMLAMEQTIDVLKVNNNQLHFELKALQTLRTHLEDYASETKVDFTEILGEANQSFQRLEAITIENERALLHRIAQDLEFLDHKPGMCQDEYQRFIERIPTHLNESFINIGNTTFDHLSGDDQQVDYHKIKTLVQTIIDNKAVKKRES